MFKNYFITAFRNHLKNKWNSLINIFSLAIGIACSILIFVYVSNELSYDHFHKNVDNIYRVIYRLIDADGETNYSTLQPYALVNELRTNYPTVEKATAFRQSRTLVEYNNRRFIENIALVDSTFLTMFTFPLITGNPETVLLTTDHIVITKEIADNLFGDLKNDYSQVVGKVISLHRGTNKKNHIITGVLEPLPKTSSIQFDVLVLMEGNDLYGGSNNPFGRLSLYVQLMEGITKDDVEASLHPLVSKYFGKRIYDFRQRGVLQNTDDCFMLKVQHLTDVYFNPEVFNSYESHSNKTYSYILIGIGLLILTLACINFITLSIGQSLNRTTEIGIRKVLGAAKIQIIAQYSFEKILLIILAFVFGYFFADLLLPTFNQLSKKELSISFFDNLGIPVFLFFILIISSFFAAGIPALTLSRFQPVGIFRAISKLGGKSKVNSILVIVQFFLSILLLSSTFIMSRQISFMQNNDLGFDKDRLVNIPILKTYSEFYKNKIQNYPEIINVTGCDRNFMNGSSTRIFTTQTGKPVSVRMIRIEEEYLNTMRIDLLEGRNFSKSFPADQLNSVLVNEAFVKEFDLQAPVGSVIAGEMQEGAPTVIGVVRDYHIDSMHKEVQPLILHMTNEIWGSWSVFVKLKAGNIRKALDILQTEWNNTVPDREFKYTFLDDGLNLKYENEERWLKITGISTLFAFIISSLGLFGLAIIIINLKTKEIGIRKVLGASIANIITVLTKDITKWIVFANLVAWPTTWYVMNKWLQIYAYHIDINWLTFLLAGLIAMVIALLSVSFHAIRAAIANPVESLKYE